MEATAAAAAAAAAAEARKAMEVASATEKKDEEGKLAPTNRSPLFFQSGIAECFEPLNDAQM